MSCQMSRSRGFTLCELMVVLAIVSIMAGVGTVSLLGMKQRMKLTGLANVIKGDLNRGKIIAARQKSYVVLQISDGFYELFVDNGAGGATPGDWLLQGDEVRLARREIDQSLSLASNFPGDHLRLRSSGRIRPGRFTITGSGDRQMAVVVNAVGRIRLEGPTSG